MVGSDAPGRIPLRVKGEAALRAVDVAPARAVGLLPVSAAAAPLAGGAGIDRGDGHARHGRLGARAAEQAGEGPRVEATAPLSASPHAVADGGQVLQDRGGAGLHGRNHGRAEPMGTVPAATCLAARHRTQAPFIRPCALRLERAAPAGRAGIDFAPVARSAKVGLGGHGGACHTEVNAERLSCGRNLRSRRLDDDREPQPTLAVHAEAGRTSRPVPPRRRTGRDGRRHRLAPRNGCQRCVPRGQVDLRRTHVVADGHVARPRTRRLRPLARARPTGRNGLGRLHAGGTAHPCQAIGCGTLRSVGLMVKCDTVAPHHPPLHGADAVARCGVPRDGVAQHRFGLRTRLYARPRRPVHAHTRPPMVCLYRRREGAAIPPSPEDDGLLAVTV